MIKSSFIWIRLAALAMVLFLLITNAQAQQSSNTQIDKWSLWTQGTKLRGANIHQRRVYPDLDNGFLGSNPVGPPQTLANLQRLADLGANYVNISHPGLFTEKTPFQVDTDIGKNLDSLLYKIQAAGMYAVISFRTGPGRSEFTFFWDDDWFGEKYLNDTVWQDAAAQNAWATMWRYTAERYKDNPIVVGYDLMVEPNSNEVGYHAFDHPLDEWDPETFYANYGNTLYDWNQFYPGIVDAIREVDTATPILIGGMGYSALNWLPYMNILEDTMVVYTFHQYQPHVYTHQDPPLNKTYPGYFDTDWDGDKDNFNQAWLSNLYNTVDLFKQIYNVPVAVNEFGLMRWEPGAAKFMDDQMTLIEEKGLNHALWSWATDWTEYEEEVDAFNFRHGPDPDHHQNVASSELLDVIKKYWARNTEFYTTVEDVSRNPAAFLLKPPYPNPFNSTCHWQFSLERPEMIQLHVVDIRGRFIKKLLDNNLKAGKQQGHWDGRDSSGQPVASGLYFLQLMRTSGNEIKKMVLVR